MSKVAIITRLIRMANSPLFANACACPSHKKTKISAENAADPMTTGRHQACVANSAMPPTTKPSAARPHETPARDLTNPSPRSVENVHEPSGQVISGRSWNSLALCPRYNK
jgi:hypothetical protein